MRGADKLADGRGQCTLAANLLMVGKKERPKRRIL
jgi:hypothetical protein